MGLVLVICAAGSSSRMGGTIKKEYLPLKSGTVLSCAALSFLKTAVFDAVAVTIPQGHETQARQALYADPQVRSLLPESTLLLVTGGSTRQKSVYNAIQKLCDHVEAQGIDPEDTIVLIHDGARPYVSCKVIGDTIDAAGKYGASVPGLTPVDTQKEMDGEGYIKTHLVRSRLAAVQTPQAFNMKKLLACHQRADAEHPDCTDDTEVWDLYPQITGGQRVKVVEGSVENIKITYPGDITTEASGTGRKTMTRIGIGTDMHRLTEGRKLWLGGIEIPSEKGELGHSDGDALLHAISDALLGASGLGDIGSYFPPEEPQWKDADSKVLLKKIWDDVRNAGWQLNNLDCVVEMEKPKFLPWRQKVIQSIASVLDVNEDQVFVKAKTNEKLDSVGQWNAVKTICICMLVR